MFLLISFVFAKNICIEKTPGRCLTLCSSFHINFDMNYSDIPHDYVLNSLPGDDIHDLYIADNTNYKDTSHNLIFCDPSNYLIYDNIVSSLSIAKDIVADNKIIKPNIPILFQIESDLNLKIDTIDDTQAHSSIILEAIEENIVVRPLLLTEQFPKKIIKISENSKEIKIIDKSSYVQSLFEQNDKLVELPKIYYCISDKENKCEKYSSYNLTFINQTCEIGKYPNVVLIIDSSIPLIYINHNKYDNYDHYFHIIGMPGSDLTYSIEYTNSDLLILHSDYIEIPNGKFEGEGSFTFIPKPVKFFTTTTINNFNFAIKSRQPLDYYSSQINAYNPNIEIDLINKIKVPEFCIFHGDKSLSKLFEPGKFINDDEIYVNDVTVGKLNGYPYIDIIYYFTDGVHDIPKTWNTISKFRGNKKTSFIFNDVCSFDNNKIDAFIDVSSYERITINPSKYFYLRQFSVYNYDIFTINVDHDFIMAGPPHYDTWTKRDEIIPDKNKCKIVGKGTIKFFDEKFMDDIKYFCDIEETVNLEKLNVSSKPKYNICVGQSNLEKCKEKIQNIDSLNDYEWLWLRNVDIKHFNFMKQFITDVQYITKPSSDLIVTSSAHLIYIKELITLDNNFIIVEKNGVDTMKGVSKTSKITVLCFSDYYYGNFIYNFKMKFEMFCNEVPNNLDIHLHFYYENVKFVTSYIENFTQKLIALDGKCTIFVREQYRHALKNLNIFDTIKFAINPDNDFEKVCFADSENSCFGDYILAKNYDEFVEYEALSKTSRVYLFKDITIQINNKSLTHSTFYCQKQIRLSIDLPNDPIVLFFNSYIEVITTEKTYRFDQISYVYPIFDVKDKVTFNNYWSYLGNKSIELKSSKSIVEIIPHVQMNHFEHIHLINNFTIISPAPHYIKHLFDPYVNVIQSPSWSYLYNNETCKRFLTNYTVYPLEDYQNDDNLLENIVLAVEEYDNVTIPSNWKSHNIFILNQNEYTANILLTEQPESLTFLVNGFIINNKTKFINGDIHINVPQAFKFNAEFHNDVEINYLMYQSTLLCKNNYNTYIFPGNLSIKNYYRRWAYIRVYGISSDNMLYIKSTNSDDYNKMWYLLNVEQQYLSSSYIYDYICYYPLVYDESKCPSNSFHVTNEESLLNAINENPGIPVLLGQNLSISQSNYHYILYINEENIKVSFPVTIPYINTYKKSLSIFENDHIQIECSDRSFVDIYNKSTIEIVLTDNNIDWKLYNTFNINCESNTNSSIIFRLDTNIFISTESNFPPNFSIAVKKNNNHNLYTSDIDKFANVFDKPSFCTYKKRELLENVFNPSFHYNETEIAFISNRSIELPNISHYMNVNIIRNSHDTLNVKTIYNLSISGTLIVLNNFWRVFGERELINYQLNKSISLIIYPFSSIPTSIQLTDDNTEINLISCDKNKPGITIYNNGNPKNKIKVFGSRENYENFLSNIISHDGISIELDGVQNYLCLCSDEFSCSKCEEGIDGFVKKTPMITSDPGENVKIRVFSDIEISSTIFTNENEVYINPDNHLILSNVEKVDQNISEGIKVDNLYFPKASNLLIKPKGIQINIIMKPIDCGPDLLIEINVFLRLNVINSNDERINASKLYISGKGELNIYNYPYEQIFANSTVKLIKGIYTICNSSAGNNICNYISDEGYKILNIFDGFFNNFDPDSKIIVVLNSFSNIIIDADINYLNGQKIIFIRDSTYLNSHLLDDYNAKIRFYPTTELIRKSDLTTELTNSLNGALLDSSDSDLFIVGFNESLTIKQNGNALSTNQIILQPMNEKVTITVDDSVDIENQKIKIETENEKPVSVTIKSDKNIPNNDLNNFFNVDSEKVSFIIDSEKVSDHFSLEHVSDRFNSEKVSDHFSLVFASDQLSSEKIPGQFNSEPEPLPKNKLPKGALIGIVVGVVAIIVIVIVIVVIIVIIKKRSKSLVLSESENTDESGSLRI